MYANFCAHIKNYVGLEDAEISLLLPYLKHEKVEKKAHLLKQGQPCTSLYFVSKGCLRMYFINDTGNEQITQFAIENWWLSDYMSFEKETPASFYIQAVEASEVIVLEKQYEEALLSKIPKLERYFRLVLQKAVAASQLRIKYLYGLSGEERYIQFNKAFPAFVQRIPQYMLASYLGFTPEFMSKIRAKRN